MIITIAHATVSFDQVDGDLWMLGFADHVTRAREGRTELVPTGLQIQVGPMTRQLAEELARGIRTELSGVVLSNGGPT